MSKLASIIQEANASIFEKEDLECVDRLFASDYAVHINGNKFGGGPATVRTAIGTLRRAFPELSVGVDVFVQSDNRISWQRTLSGIQRGPYQGFPATNREIVWRDMLTTEFRDGKIAEEWVVTDLAEHLLRGRKS